MDITIFLAQIWGPIILALGIGVFTSRNHYRQLYRDLEKETLAVLSFGIFGMVLGIIHIQIHNAWDTVAQIIVSLLGWSLLLKATLFILAPKIVDRGSEWAAKANLLPIAGVLMLCGGYLSWVGYFA
jgi:hypothetical protein